MMNMRQIFAVVPNSIRRQSLPSFRQSTNTHKSQLFALVHRPDYLGKPRNILDARLGRRRADHPFRWFRKLSVPSYCIDSPQVNQLIKMIDKEKAPGKFASFPNPCPQATITNLTDDDNLMNSFIPEYCKLIDRDSSNSKSSRFSIRKRFITRDGRCAVRKINRLGKPYLYYMNDLVSAVLECRWRYVILWYTALNMISWYLFAVLWWIIAYSHDDLSISPRHDPAREPCVTEMKDMLSAFMFSVETQYTTGYGTRGPTTACPEAVFMMCVQNIIGMLLQSCSLGIIFAKLARPKARTQAIKFSERAVISMRDGYLCLMFRIADMRKSHVISCEVKGWVLKTKMTTEGELLAQHRYRLTLNVDDGGSDTFLVWPVTVVHRIDRNSPLYEVSPEELFSSDFEIVTSLTCTIESTGQAMEARRSYVPAEIMWGHRFKNIIRRNNGACLIDYNNFDKTTTVDTALCSAKSLYVHSWLPTSRISLATGFKTGLADKVFFSVSRQASKDVDDTSAEDELLSALSSNS